MLFTINQRFCADRAVLTPGLPGDVENLWADAMSGKCLDPMMSVIMCYELIRRGKALQNADQIRMVANNLSRYFGLPDSQAVLNLIGEREQIPKTAPLFVDGVIPYAEMPSLLPFRAPKSIIGVHGQLGAKSANSTIRRLLMSGDPPPDRRNPPDHRRNTQNVSS